MIWRRNAIRQSGVRDGGGRMFCHAESFKSRPPNAPVPASLAASQLLRRSAVFSHNALLPISAVQTSLTARLIDISRRHIFRRASSFQILLPRHDAKKRIFLDFRLLVLDQAVFDEYFLGITTIGMFARNIPSILVTLDTFHLRPRRWGNARTPRSGGRLHALHDGTPKYIFFTKFGRVKTAPMETRMFENARSFNQPLHAPWYHEDSESE